MLSRRKFLYIASLTAVAASAPFLPISFRLRRKKKYFITTQSIYWSKQNLERLEPYQAVDLLGYEKFDSSKPFSILTVVDEDGGNLKRIALPRRYHMAHSSEDGSLVYLIGNHAPSAVVVLDLNTLEVIRVLSRPSTEDPVVFGGHAVNIPESNLIAFSLNQASKGNYDFISIRDANTLKEVERFSSYGFQVHEIRLTPDKKHFLCGHYGSYLGQGPYEGMGIYQDSPKKYYDKKKEIYPALISLVDANDGKKIEIFSHREAGQEGHAVSDEAGKIYLPNIAPLIDPVQNIEENPFYHAPLAKGSVDGKFRSSSMTVGISIAYDQKHREVIVPDRGNFGIFITNVDTQESKRLELKELLESTSVSWLKPKEDLLSGLEFHPNGKEYIISTSDGFLCLERGTHRVISEKSFVLPLEVHSHMHIV